MRRVNVALGAAVVAGLGAIAATVWVGARVREDTVVENPYEEGLRHDAERAARGALGVAVTLEDEAPEAGAAPLRFALADRAGEPVEDAAVTVGITRADTSRDGRRAAARAEGGGRFVAELAFPVPGRWDVRFDVVRGEDRVRLEKRVVVRAACDLAAGACARPIPGAREVVLELSPRPLRTMREIVVRVAVRGTSPTSTATSTSTPTPGSTPTSTSTSTSTPTSTSTSTSSPPPTSTSSAPPTSTSSPPPTSGRTPTVSFLMPGMEMGENRATLASAGPGAWAGTAVLVRCPSGRRDWIAEVSLPGDAKVRFPFTVAEER